MALSECACVWEGPPSDPKMVRACIAHLEWMQAERRRARGVEIEACAKIADDLLQAGRAHRNVGRDEETALLSCAAAIRARGKTEG